MSLLLLVLGEEEQDPSLNKMISHSIEDYVEWFCWWLWDWEKEGFNVFANYLSGTTIQNGDKREKSDDLMLYHHLLTNFV